MEINEYISKNCITFSLDAKTKDEAINELAEILFLNHKISNTKLFIEAVNKRELEYTTGIGDGIAIPHGQSNVVKNACIAFGKSKEGVEWNSLDQKPVYMIFMLAIPIEEDEVHLEMLSNLARKLMHKEVKEAISIAKDEKEFYKAIK